MASKGSKGMEIKVAGKGLKRLRKGTKRASSSKAKARYAKLFGVQAVEPHGLTYFNTQMEAKYAPKHWIFEGRLAQEFSAISDKLHELGVGYIFVEPEECNLTLCKFEPPQHDPYQGHPSPEALPYLSPPSAPSMAFCLSHVKKWGL
ncbi:hypothetical protein HAX54_037535 [Datura stramonium]|uniref:Uncharacterized protein n=1 Tax=Datura stramonium TaxID=4076 RepID=A0ABS8VIE8_DATST|nr:hypothetical protein [Datura stramonium]